MAKILTHAEWSKLKKDAGADDAIRDQWHIGDHLDKYHKLPATDSAGQLEALTDLQQKFVKYKKALVEKNKDDKFEELITEIASIIKKVEKESDTATIAKGVAEGSVEAMKKECLVHLDLRKKMVPFVAEVVKELNGLLSDIKTQVTLAEQGRDQAKNAKNRQPSVDTTGNMQGIALASTAYLEAQKICDRAINVEKEKISKPSGKLIKSRGDGPIGADKPTSTRNGSRAIRSSRANSLPMPRN